jgi:hypothetical protein
MKHFSFEQIDLNRNKLTNFCGTLKVNSSHQFLNYFFEFFQDICKTTIFYADQVSILKKLFTSVIYECS